MAKNTLKLGKFVKKKNPDKENQYIWTMKQSGKLSGAHSRALKAALDKAVSDHFRTDEPQN